MEGGGIERTETEIAIEIEIEIEIETVAGPPAFAAAWAGHAAEVLGSTGVDERHTRCHASRSVDWRYI